MDLFLMLLPRSLTRLVSARLVWKEANQFMSQCYFFKGAGLSFGSLQCEAAGNFNQRSHHPVCLMASSQLS